MNKLFREMLIGVILGDAHIGKTGLDKAFISFEQSKSKLEYFNLLYNLTKEEGLELEEIITYSRTDIRSNQNTESLYFRTQSLDILRPLADKFLDESGKKVIPTNIADLLTPRSLAFWIMDDGQQVKRGGVTLCTDSFKSNEIQILREALKTNFNLETSIHNKKASRGDSMYERIYINKSSLDLVKPSLKEHMHESMLYKINEVSEIETFQEIDTGFDID
jgi:hypothetical protein